MLPGALEAGEGGAGLDGLEQLVDARGSVGSLKRSPSRVPNATESVARQAAACKKVQMFMGDDQLGWHRRT